MWGWWSEAGESGCSKAACRLFQRGRRDLSSARTVSDASARELPHRLNLHIRLCCALCSSSLLYELFWHVFRVLMFAYMFQQQQQHWICLKQQLHKSFCCFVSFCCSTISLPAEHFQCVLLTLWSGLCGHMPSCFVSIQSDWGQFSLVFLYFLSSILYLIRSDPLFFFSKIWLWLRWNHSSLFKILKFNFSSFSNWSSPRGVILFFIFKYQNQNL